MDTDAAGDETDLGDDSEFIVTMLCFRCMQGSHVEIFSGQEDWRSEQKSQWDAKIGHYWHVENV